MIAEFKKFILRGNVVDMAVGIIIGSAFGAIVRSLVDDIIMPPVGLLLGNVDFTDMYTILRAGDPAGPYDSLTLAQEAGAVTLNYGVFINTLVTFLIIALAVFFLVRFVNRLEKKEKEEPAAEPTTKKCPFCDTEIPIKAQRCPNCTSQL